MLQRRRISITLVVTLCLLVSLPFVANGAVQAENSVIVVNTSTYFGNDGCETGECTLLEALALANSRPGVDTIHFNIPGEGPHTIQPGERLVMNEVIVDGYSQPGAHPSTSSDPKQMDAKLMIEIDGSGLPQDVSSRGGLVTSGSTVKGLILNRFPFYAFRSNGGLIQGNFIGTDATGSVALPNGGGFEAVAGVRIEGNVIAGNRGAAVTIFNSNVEIVGNRIGVGLHDEVLPNEAGIVKVPTEDHVIKLERNIIANHPSYPFALNGQSQVVGNIVYNNAESGSVFGRYLFEGNTVSKSAVDGVVLSAGYPNVIRNNVITENAGRGIYFFGGGQLESGKLIVTGNTISANGGAGISIPGGGPLEIQGMNRFYNNGGLGIDLGPTGVTPNDPLDEDTGANLLQNFPILEKVVRVGAQTTIAVSLNSRPNTQYTLDFFANTSCDPSGYGEGERYLDSAVVFTDGSGNARATVDTNKQAQGEFVTATATDPSGNSSEFSQCVAVTKSGVTITIVKDSIPDTPRNFRYYGPFGEFRLDDPGVDDNDGVARSITYQVVPGSYGFSELQVNGWRVTDIRCSNPARAIVNLPQHSLTLNLLAGDDVTCTFVNEQAVTVYARAYWDKNVSRFYDVDEPWKSGVWTEIFDSTGKRIVANHTDSNGQVGAFNLVPGAYSVCQTPPTGWWNTQPGKLDPRFGKPCYSFNVAPAGLVTGYFGWIDRPFVTASEEEVEAVGGLEVSVFETLEEETATGTNNVYLPIIVH